MTLFEAWIWSLDLTRTETIHFDLLAWKSAAGLYGGNSQSYGKPITDKKILSPRGLQLALPLLEQRNLQNKKKYMVACCLTIMKITVRNILPNVLEAKNYNTVSCTSKPSFSIPSHQRTSQASKSRLTLPGPPASFCTAPAVHRQAVSSRLNARRNFLTKQSKPVPCKRGSHPCFTLEKKNYDNKKKIRQVWKQLTGWQFACSSRSLSCTDISLWSRTGNLGLDCVSTS